MWLFCWQRRKETEADATFKEFYKNKYRRSHMHNSRHIDTTHKYTKNTAVKNEPQCASSSSSSRGALTRSVLDNTSAKTNRFDTIGSFDASKPILNKWDAVKSRQHITKGHGSTYQYQFGKDHHTSRGPPYHVNNTNAVWQR